MANDRCPAMGGVCGDCPHRNDCQTAADLPADDPPRPWCAGCGTQPPAKVDGVWADICGPCRRERLDAAV